MHAGIRLSLYEHTENPAASAGANGSGSAPGADPRNGQEFTNAAKGSLPAPVPSPDFRYGERLRIRAKLHRPRNFRNPGAFDYEGYLRDSGISLLGSAPMANVERLPGFSGSRIMLWRARVHASIIAKIHRLWPASQATLMDAMVLGEESFLRNSTRTEFQRGRITCWSFRA